MTDSNNKWSKQRIRTRNGCTNCRKSKVKCDEQQPSCTRCWQRGFTCTREKISLKWEEDYHSRGLAFGRAGVWKKKPTVADQKKLQNEENDWCSTAAVYPWSFINSDPSTFRQLYTRDITASSLGYVSVSPTIDYGYRMDGSVSLLYSPSMFPNWDKVDNTMIFEYYVHQVCPRTTSSHNTTSPFASVILPYCLNGSATILRAIQALGACYRSQTNPDYSQLAIRLKSEVLSNLRRRIKINQSFVVSEDPEILVLMMMLCLYDIVDRCDKSWIVHLQGAKDIIRLRKNNLSLSSQTQDPVTSFVELFFAFQDVMGRTACAKADLFGPTYWDENDHQVNPWMGCSPELTSILFSILDLSRTRRQISTDSEQAKFSMKASVINRRLLDLEQVVDDPEDRSLQAVAQLKRLACFIYLHCALYNTGPSDSIVILYVGKILKVLQELLEQNLSVNAMWPIFVAAVELDAASDETWTDPTTGDVICGRALILRCLTTMSSSSISSVARARTIIEKVWQARDLDIIQRSGRSLSCNDWEWYVVPLSDALSLV